MDTRQKEKVVLFANQFMWLQDENAGQIKVYVGPGVVDPATHERPVLYHPRSDTFSSPTRHSEAVQPFTVVPQGSYGILHNPRKDGAHPEGGSQDRASNLLIGQRVVINGPSTFPLEPGQHSQVIDGHTLHSDELVLIRILDEAAARENWEDAVIRAANSDEEEGMAEVIKGMAVPDDIAVGKEYSIKGTEYSFYMPPTGVEVVPDPDSGEYVRKALSLEALEYAILINEDGSKRYPRGPQVVFPEPSERFYVDGNNSKSFRAIELNEIQRLHLKAIADFKFVELDNKEFKEGTEFSITGAQVPIFFPRPEIALVKYDGKTVHYAVAVPEGEGRYVMNRKNGEVSLEKGPTMLLPDPVDQVVVRRVLSDRECEDYFPGNEEVLEHNRQLLRSTKGSPTTRQGRPSDGDYERSQAGRAHPKGGTPRSKRALPHGAEASLTSMDQAAVADEISRGSTFTSPRSITLNTKLQGAVRVQPWTGFAVQVANTDGSTKVVIGPADLLLEYGQRLQHLFMSAGRPKGSKRRKRTVYLGYINSRVGDKMKLETSDHVSLNVELEFIVDFDVEKKDLWWTVEDYPRLLAEKVRSMLRAYVRSLSIAEFYSKSEVLLRDFILGDRGEDGNRKGLCFEENGMMVRDVNIVAVALDDHRVQEQLLASQREAVLTAITLERSRARVVAIEETEKLSMDEAEIKAATMVHGLELELKAIERRQTEHLARVEDQHKQNINDLRVHFLSLGTKMGSEFEIQAERATLEHQSRLVRLETENVEATKKLEAALAKAEKEFELSKAREIRTQTEFEATQARKKDESEAVLLVKAANLEQIIKIEMNRTDNQVKVLEGLKGGITELFAAVNDRDTMVRVAEAMSLNRLLDDDDMSEDIVRLLQSAGLGGAAERLLGAIEQIGE